MGAWFVQGVPLLAKPAPGEPVPGVQIVEHDKKIDEEKKYGTDYRGKREETRPTLPSFPQRTI